MSNNISVSGHMINNNDDDDDDDPLLDAEMYGDWSSQQTTCKSFYTLPRFRYVNVIKGLLFIDGFLTAILWLTGGDSQYFVDNILQFHMRQSVFDLVLINEVKMVLLSIVYYFMELMSFRQIDQPFDVQVTKKKCLCHVTAISINLICFAYSVTKGGNILYAILNETNTYTPMHIEYNVLVITSIAFGLLQFLLSFYSFRAMRKLRAMRILHRFNDYGQEIDSEGHPVKKKANLKRVLLLASPEAGMLMIGFVALIISSIAQMLAPLFFGKVVDAALKSMDALNKTVLTLLGIYFGGSIASMVRCWIFNLAGQRLVARLRTDIFNNLICQEVAFYDKTRTGELTNRLSSDTQVLQNAVTVNVSMLLRYLLQIIGSLAVMFVLNPALTGVLLGVVPLVSFGAVQYGHYLKKLRKAFQDNLAEAGTAAEESISSLRTVRSFACENKVQQDYSEHIQKSYNIGKKLSAVQGTLDGSVGFISYAAICLVLWYGGKLVNEKTVSPGLLTSFLLYTLQVAMAFAFLSSIYGDFMQAVGASSRVFELLDREPLISMETGVCPDKIDGAVEFCDVKFCYPSRPENEVLKGVSFKVESGNVIALVGPSGGGKSTIVNLIERFYDPDSGKIFLGGFHIKTLNPSWFRKQIAMVGQEPTLFACSIRDNIAFGRDSTPEEIVDAAKKANAHNFIMSFEEGYDTLVGERGIRLSGGQKQRVAIARALIMNPSLLLLDEATSALDAESEHLVQQAIDRALVGRTVIVIAHRLSTVRNAAQVLVIDKGCIVEQGTHDELLALNGVYKRLVVRQLAVPGNIDAPKHPATAENQNLFQPSEVYPENMLSAAPLSRSLPATASVPIHSRSHQPIAEECLAGSPAIH
ncbi:ABC transporter B family member 27 [Octopus sinensis]|uniref:ABC transporter B family member 27 n=1 Tax=Octopus sinensis TaxID=2607531 RepID=A0A6P7SJI9_9MOLL|nr:ABC transporter B family member 27 [Octopus sinensis]